MYLNSFNRKKSSVYVGNGSQLPLARTVLSHVEDGRFIIEEGNKTSKSIVQYVVIRGDLIKTMQWPVGAIVAQACHACTAVTHLFYDDEHTQAYLADLDNMHKVVLEAPNESSLRELNEKLEEDKVDHKLWIEQPENIPTCLVAKPYPKEDVQKYFRKFKLFKN